MLSLPNPCLFYVFSNLSLEDLANNTLVCKKFNKFIYSQNFLNMYIPLLGSEELKKRNLKFLKKFEDKLSIKQITEFDYSFTINQMMKAGFYDDDENKNNRFVRLIYSIERLMKNEKANRCGPNQSKFGDNWETENPNLQLEYPDFFTISTFDKQYFIKMQEEFNNNTERDKIIISSKKETKLKFIEIFKNNHFKLKNSSYPELVEFYTNLCIKYNEKTPRCLNLNINLKCMPSEIFVGICNYVKINNVTDSQIFKSYNLNDNDLKTWNSAFKDCKIHLLTMHLEIDIKKETLLDFISIIKNQDLKFHVEVEFFCNKTPTNAEREVIELFTNFKNELSNHKKISRWELR